MKKLMKSLMLFAAAAMALTSCENEAMNEGIEANDTYTMTFVAGAPESKTSVAIDGNNATFSWSETGEKLYFLQYGGGKIYKNQSEEGVIEGDKATFSVEFTSQVEGVTTYTYSAIYPSTSFVNENDDWNGVEVKIPEMQVFVENSYDPAADLMVAQPIEADYNDTKIHNLKFTRLAAVAKMNVKNITAGEVIQTIEFALAEGTKFVGEEASVDVENSVLVEGGNKNSITLVPANELTTTGEAISVFFTCFPIEYTGDYTLTVETDKATYSNSGTITTPLTFTVGDVLNFNIKAGERTVKSENVASWYKINSLSELAVGDKVALVGTTGSGSYSMTGGNGSTAPTVSKVTFNADGTLASVVGLTTFNIGKDGSNYILYAGEDTTSWLYCTTTNNGVRVGTNSNKVWTIASHTNNGSDFEFKHNGTNRYLGIYSNNNWRCYTSVSAGNFTNDTGTSDIAIYKYGMSGETPSPDPEPEPEPEPEITLETGEGEGTEASPYDVTRALEAIEKGHESISSAYVKGIVTETAMQYFEKYSSLTYYISVDGTTENELMVYSGKGLNGEGFTSVDDLHAGDEVVIKGELKVHNDIKEFNMNSQIVSLVCGHQTVDPIEIEVEENVNIAAAESADTIPVNVIINNDAEWTYEARETVDVDWLEVDWDNGVYYVAGENTGAERTATVEINATDGENEKTVTFTITQAAGSNGGGGDVAYYEKVTEAPADWSGTYLIVYEDGTNAYVFNGQDAVNGYVSATISDSKIAVTDALNSVSVEIAKSGDGYSIKTANGYIYGTSGSNKLNFNATTPQANTISWATDNVEIESNTSVLRFNNASNQMRFRYYKSSSYSAQKATQLYKLAN